MQIILYLKSLNKKIVFIEAKIQMKPWTTFPTEEKAIEVFESWLIHYLAVNQWIECICVQPTHEEEINNLRHNDISEDIILLFEFWTLAGFWVLFKFFIEFSMVTRL